MLKTVNKEPGVNYMKEIIELSDGRTDTNCAVVTTIRATLHLQIINTVKYFFSVIDTT